VQLEPRPDSGSPEPQPDVGHPEPQWDGGPGKHELQHDSLASSTSTREYCPDMDDYHQTLMELGSGNHLKSMGIDQWIRLWAAAQHRGTLAAVQWDSAWIGHWMRLLAAARHWRTRAARQGSRPGPIQQTPLSSVIPPPSNEPILVYTSNQQILTDANLTTGYEILLNSPTEYPLKQENLESCLAMARTKLENEYGATADTQFAVQISTEVRVQNLETFALKSDFKTSGKEEEKKEK
jgi:hypothetical protein